MPGMPLYSLSPSRSHTYTLVSTSTAACLQCPHQKARHSSAAALRLKGYSDKRRDHVFDCSLVFKPLPKKLKTWVHSLPLSEEGWNPGCCHPVVLFLHDLFIETTATFSHKQLEKVKIFYSSLQRVGDEKEISSQLTVRIQLGNTSSTCPWKSWLVFRFSSAQGWKKRILEALVTEKNKIHQKW